MRHANTRIPALHPQPAAQANPLILIKFDQHQPHKSTQESNLSAVYCACPPSPPSPVLKSIFQKEAMASFQQKATNGVPAESNNWKDEANRPPKDTRIQTEVSPLLLDGVLRVFLSQRRRRPLRGPAPPRGSGADVRLMAASCSMAVGARLRPQPMAVTPGAALLAPPPLVPPEHI